MSLIRGFYPDLNETTQILFDAVYLLNNRPSLTREKSEISTFELYGKCKSQRIFSLQSSHLSESLKTKENLSDGKTKSLLIKSFFLKIQRNYLASFSDFEFKISNRLFHRIYGCLNHCKRYKALRGRTHIANTKIRFVEFQHFFKHLWKNGLNLYNEDSELKGRLPIYNQKSRPMTNQSIRLSPNDQKPALSHIAVNLNSQKTSTIQLHFKVSSNEFNQRMTNKHVVGSRVLHFQSAEGKKRIVLRGKKDGKPVGVISFKTIE